MFFREIQRKRHRKHQQRADVISGKPLNVRRLGKPEIIFTVSGRYDKRTKQSEKEHNDGKPLLQIIIPSRKEKLRTQQIIHADHADAQSEVIISPDGIFPQRKIPDSAKQNGHGDGNDSVTAFPSLKRFTVCRKMKNKTKQRRRRITDIRKKQIERIVQIGRECGNEKKRQRRGQNVIADDQKKTDEYDKKDGAFHFPASPYKQTGRQCLKNIKRIAVEEFS